jgi:hypothetical protein
VRWRGILSPEMGPGRTLPPERAQKGRFQDARCPSNLFVVQVAESRMIRTSTASWTRVIHTYDWTQLTDESRRARALATTADKLSASLTRLAAMAEHDAEHMTASES